LTKCLVTGVAGFIGSHLAERLIADGHQVIGIDCFTDYYPRVIKERNIQLLLQNSVFQLVEADLTQADLPAMLEGVDWVFHLAAQAGVRASWGKSFESYTTNNILATQRLLEAVKGSAIRKFVFASSSSVYGNAETLPTSEDVIPQPVSPYGITKLTCEHLGRLYWQSYDVPVVTMRYFTVYGPRQRPDMAFHKFIRAALEDREIVIYGDGEQTRDFTFVADTVDGTVRAAQYGIAGHVYNLGGGTCVSVNEVLNKLDGILSKSVQRHYIEQQTGDVQHTSSDTRHATNELGYAPHTPLTHGLGTELEWIIQQEQFNRTASKPHNVSLQ